MKTRLQLTSLLYRLLVLAGILQSFIVKGQSLAITSPTSGSTLNACSYEKIQWTTGGSVPYVDVLYSLDNGINWAYAVYSAANTGNYQLQVPSGAKSNGFAVLIRNSNNNPINSSISGLNINTSGYNKLNITSAFNFSYSPTDYLYFNWNNGQTTCVKNVKIELSTNGGVNFPVTLAGNNSNSGNYGGYSLPAVNTPNAVVRITDVYNPGNFALSSTFEIKGGSAPYFTILAPLANEIVSGCSNYTVKVKGNIPSYFNMEYSADNGANWVNFGSIYGNGSNTQIFPVSSIAGTYKIRFVNQGNPSISFLGSNFTVVASPPNIKLTTPSANSVYGQGSAYYVYWDVSASCVQKSNLSVSSDEGNTWNTIATNLNNTSGGYYYWTMPPSIVGSNLLKVSDAANPANSSTGVFYVSQPLLTVLGVASPQGAVCSSSNIAISWKTTGITSNYYNLDYSTNGGNSWNTIQNNVYAYYTSDPKTFYWTPPASISGNVMVRVTEPTSFVNGITNSFVVTTPSNPTVGISSPSSNYDICSNVYFKWSGNGVCNVNLYVTTNNGASLIPVTSNVAGNSYYYWIAPVSLSGISLKAVVRDATNPAVSILGNSFTIVNNSSFVSLTPGSGSYTSGSSMYISWTNALSCAVANAKIELSTNGGVNFFTVASTPNYGYYSYTLPFINTTVTNAKLKISDPLNANNSFVGGNFTIIPASLLEISNVTITSAVNSCGTTSFGFTRSTSVYYERFSVDLSLDNGASWTNVIDGQYAYSYNTYLANYSVTLPNIATSTAKLRVWYRDSPYVSSVSNTFSIMPAGSITNVYPTSATTYLAGSSNTMYYSANSSCISKVNIEYSINGGANYTVLASNYPNVGYFSFVAPNAPTTDGRIRIKDVNSTVNGISQPFTIKAPPTVITVSGITGPVQACSALNISWNYIDNSGAYFDFYYSIDNGTTWKKFALNKYAGGYPVYSASVNLPNPVSSTNYKIKVANADGSASGVSNSFLVNPSTAKAIKITAPLAGGFFANALNNNIQWNTTAPGCIKETKVEYSLDGGENWKLISSNTPINDDNTSLSWYVPGNIASLNAVIKISDVANATVNGTSGAFTIGTPFINITSPGAGQIVDRNTYATIGYNYGGMTGESFYSYYSTDGGVNWSTIGSVAYLNGSGSGTYTSWYTPYVSSITTVQIAFGNAYYYYSASKKYFGPVFYIAPPNLNTVSVTGLSTTSACQGRVLNVTYNATGTFNAGNVFYAEIGSSTAASPGSLTPIGNYTSTANSGTFSVTIPSGFNGQYQIRVYPSNPYVNNFSSQLYSKTINVSNSPCITANNNSGLSDYKACIGDEFDLAIQSSETFSAGNVFIAQLSNQFGSFANPVNVGELAATSVSVGGALIPITLPLTLPGSGSGFKLRVISTNFPSVSSLADATLNIQAACILVNNVVVTDTLCPGAPLAVDFDAYTDTNFGSGNKFEVDLSDASGNFYALGNYIGEIYDELSDANKMANATIPSFISTGNYYQFSITSTNPAAKAVVVSNPYKIHNNCFNSVSVEYLPSYIAGSPLKVYVNPLASFKAGNIYIAELSDASGNFNTPGFIGSISGTGAITIPGIIPAIASQSAYYRVRVRSTDFASISNYSSYFTIAPVSISVPTNIAGSFCPGSPLNLDLLTVLGVVQAGNIYTVKLYDNYWGTTWDLFTAASTATGQLAVPTITIPTSFTGYNYGYGYKIYVTSSNPAATSLNYSNTFYVGNNCYSNATLSTAKMRGGQSYTLSYTVAAAYPYNAANVFKAEMSDASGSFASPTVVGSSLSTTSGVINITIPANLPTGANYQFRVKSSDFVSYSNSSGAIEIQQIGIDMRPVVNKTYCPGSPVSIGAFTVTSGVQGGNIYNIEISNNNINFYKLHSIVSSSTGEIAVPDLYLPGTISGGNYFIRISSSKPYSYTSSNSFSVRSTCIDQPYINSVFCPNEISYTSIYSASFDAGNVFNLVLSDDKGNFGTPLIIGSAASVGGAGVYIPYTIPGFLPTGTGYKAKIVSSAFAFESMQSSPFTINQLCITAPNVAGSQCSFIPVVTVAGNGIANPGNMYKLILSSPSGSFTSGTTLLSSLNSSNGGMLSFSNIALPTVAGSYYKLRVEATDPVTISPTTSYFDITNSCIGTPYVYNYNYCAGNNIELPVYISSGKSFNPGNVFSVQLSDASGSFGSPLTIYSAAGTLAYYSATVTIPSGIASGNYKIRITSSNPSFTSNSSNSFKVEQVCLSVNPIPTVPYIGNSSPISVIVNNTGAVSGGNVYSADMYSYYYGTFIGNIGTSSTNTITGTVPAVSSGGYYYVVVTSSNPVASTVQSNYFNVSRNAITLSAVPGSSYCVGSSVTGIAFNIAGTVDPGNNYYVDLSDANGNFYYGYTNLGSFADNTTGSKSASVVLPISISASPNYKIRVRSSDGSISNDQPININATFYWTGSVSKAWNNANNWSCPLVPTQDIDVVIPVIAGTNYPEININTAASKNLVINTGSKLSIINGGTLSIYGNLDVNGVLTSTGSGAVRFDGYYNTNHNINGSGAITFGIVTVPSYNYVNINRVVNVINHFYNYGYTYNYSTVGISGSFYNYNRFYAYNALNVNGLFYNESYFNVYNTYVSNPYIYVNGGFENYSTYFYPGYSRFVFGGINNYIGGTQSVSFYDIHVSSGNLTLNNTIDVSGSFYNDAAFDGSNYHVRFIPSANYLPNYIYGLGVYNFSKVIFENSYNVYLNSNIRVSGDFINIAGFSPGLNVVSFTGNGMQNITSVGINNLTFNGINVSNVNSDLNVSADVTVKGNFSNKGKFRSNKVLTLASNTSQMFGGQGQTIITDFVNNNSNTTAGITLAGHVEVQGNIVNNGMFNGSGYTITTSGASVQTISGTSNITLGEVVNTNVAGLEVTQDVQVTGSFSNRGKFRSKTNAVTFSGTQAQVVVSEGQTDLYHIVNTNTASGVSLVGTYKVAGDIVNNGSLDASASVITTSGTTVQSISGTTVVMLGSVVNNNITGIEATQDVQVTGSFSNKGRFRSANKTVTLSGNTAQTIAGTGQMTLNHLVNNNTTTGVVVASKLEVSGNIVNNGSFDASKSVITATGSSQQAVGGTGQTLIGNLVNNNVSTTVGITLAGHVEVQGSIVNNGMFNGSGYTITTSGTSVQTISGTTSAVLGEVVNTNIAGLEVIQDVQVTGSFSNKGKFRSKTNAVTFSGTQAQVVTSEGQTDLYHIVNTNTTSGVSLMGTYKVAGDIVNNGSLDASSSVITTSGTTVQSISGTTAVMLGSVVNNNTTGIEATQDIQVTGNLSNKGRFRSANKTVMLSGNTAQTIAGTGQMTLNHLVNNNTTTGVVVTNKLEVSGNIISNGSFDASKSVITATGSTAQTISGTSQLALGTIVNNNTVGGVQLHTNVDMSGNITNNGSFVAHAPVSFSGVNQTIAGTNASVLNDVSIGSTSNVALGAPLVVKGNFTNNSANKGGLRANGNHVALAGTTQQVIGGSSPTAFSGVSLSNTSGAIAMNPVSVSGISLTGGNFIASTTTIAGVKPFMVTSTAPGAVVRTSGHVVGDVTRNVANASGAYLFPVGTASNYRGATVNFTTAASGNGSINVSHNDTVPLKPTGADQPIPKGLFDASLNDSLKAVLPLSWKIKPTANITGGTYDVVLEANVTIPGYTDVSDLRIIKRENPGDTWQLLGENGTNSYTGGTLTMSRTSLTGFSEFAVSGTCSNVSRISSRPTINTITGSIDLESSLGGNNYQWSIDGVVQLLLQTQRITPVVSGKYRVKVVLNGCFTDASDELDVVVDTTSTGVEELIFDKSQVNVYPNPASKSFTFEINNAVKGKYVVGIYDLVGRQIIDKTYSVSADVTFTDLVDVSGFESGIYFIKISVANEVKVIKIVVEK